MTDVVKGVALQKLSKLPVLDFSFSVGDKTYIKPSPPFGEASKFYVNGRPRINTSGIESCPPVGLTYPKISHASWDFITKKFNSLWDKGGTYSEWLNYEEYAKKNNKSTVVCPFIEIEVTKKQVECAYKETEYLDFYKLSSMAAINFDKAVRAIFKKAVKLESIKKLPSKYLYLTVREVGRDKNNDTSSLFIKKSDGDIPIFENQRVFLLHGLAIAGAYALLYDIKYIIYSIDEEYKWV